MKSIFLCCLPFAIILTATPTYACPDLTGIYACTDGTKVVDVQVKTSHSSDKSIYVLDGQIIEANPVGISQETSGMGFRVKTTGTCIDNYLEFHQQVLTDSENQKIAESRSTYIVVKPGELKISMSAFAFNSEGQSNQSTVKDLFCTQY